MASLEVRESPGKGRGVFALQSFVFGDVVLSDPVVELDWVELATIRATALRDYWWDWGNTGAGAVVFGMASMANHDDTPNVSNIPRIAERRMDFVAIRPIVLGEEILLDYRKTVVAALES
jgi:uncharacterized protein